MRIGRRSLLITLVMALAAGVPASSSAPQAPDQGATSPAAADSTAGMRFTTPEEAIRHYMAGVAAADLTMILESTAIDQMSDGYRFDLATDRLGALVLHGSLAPADHPFYREVNRALRSQAIASQALMLVYSLLWSQQVDDSPIVPADQARADAFIAQVDPSRLRGLAVVDIGFPNPDLEEDELYLRNATRKAAVFGADESTERFVLVSFEGGLFVAGFTLLRYGSDWRVASQDSPLQGTSPLGTAEQVPETRPGAPAS